MTGIPKKAGPTVGQVQRRLRKLARELDDEAVALDGQSYDPMPIMHTLPGNKYPEPDWTATNRRNQGLRDRAEERRSIAERIRAAAKG